MKNDNQSVKQMGPNSRKDEETGVLGLGDYLQIARRRIVLVALTAMAVMVIVAIVVKHMPNVYRAETVILVDPQQVPGSLVPSIITSSVSDRLSTIQQEVTSPTRLRSLVHSLNLSAGTRKTGGEQQLIAEIQRSITVQVVDQGGRGMSAFRVGFSGKNPVEVAAIANRLAEMFIEENLKIREKQSYGTAEFLNDEQKRTKQQLDEKEAAMNQMKSKYMLDLPDSRQYHLESLATLRNQLRASQDRVNQAEQQKIYLQSLMSTQAPTVDLDTSGASGAGADPEIQKLEVKLSSLRARYGDKHPDVKKVEAELREATSQKASRQGDAEITAPAIQEANSSGRKAGKNPVLEGQIGRLNEEIEKAKSEQQALEQQIAFHEGKLQKIPLVEQSISGVMRDYDSLRAHYTALENKKLDADTASALETHDKGERFHVLDRATVPSQPYAPKRSLIGLVGVLAGLAAGLGLAVLLEILQGALHTKAEVLRIVGATPILASIPKIRTAGETRMQRLRIATVFLVTAAGSVAAGLALSYLMNKA